MWAQYWIFRAWARRLRPPHVLLLQKILDIRRRRAWPSVVIFRNRSRRPLGAPPRPINYSSEIAQRVESDDIMCAMLKKRTYIERACMQIVWTTAMHKLKRRMIHDRYTLYWNVFNFELAEETESARNIRYACRRKVARSYCVIIELLLRFLKINSKKKTMRALRQEWFPHHFHIIPHRPALYLRHCADNNFFFFFFSLNFIKSRVSVFNWNFLVETSTVVIWQQMLTQTCKYVLYFQSNILLVLIKCDASARAIRHGN